MSAFMQNLIGHLQRVVTLSAFAISFSFITARSPMTMQQLTEMISWSWLTHIVYDIFSPKNKIIATVTTIIVVGLCMFLVVFSRAFDLSPHGPKHANFFLFVLIFTPCILVWLVSLSVFKKEGSGGPVLSLFAATLVAIAVSRFVE